MKNILKNNVKLVVMGLLLVVLCTGCRKVEPIVEDIGDLISDGISSDEPYGLEEDGEFFADVEGDTPEYESNRKTNELPVLVPVEHPMIDKYLIPNGFIIEDVFTDNQATYYKETDTMITVVSVFPNINAFSVTFSSPGIVSRDDVALTLDGNIDDLIDMLEVTDSDRKAKIKTDLYAGIDFESGYIGEEFATDDISTVVMYKLDGLMGSGVLYTLSFDGTILK